MTDSISALNLEAGQVVGGYTLVGRLGGGAMGMVWTVRDAEGQLFAMKILRDSLAEDDDSARREQVTARERLRREALTLSRVRHPGVASIVDMELDDALAFIVTELIDGDTLRDDVQKNGAYVGEDLELLTEKLASAVQAVHQAGIIHRDIKPTNVMVSATGPVLVDFGIAMGEGESHVTRTGLVMGTPGFIAPEVIEGAESDELTDWWSVASVLAFAATGRPVFGSKPLMAVLEREASGNADLSGLPPRTLAAFRSALNPRRQERASIEQLLEVIRQDAVAGSSATGGGLMSGVTSSSAFPALPGATGTAHAGDWSDDPAGPSGQTGQSAGPSAVMRPFESAPGWDNPRRAWVHDPADDLWQQLADESTGDTAAMDAAAESRTRLLPDPDLLGPDPLGPSGPDTIVPSTSLLPAVAPGLEPAEGLAAGQPGWPEGLAAAGTRQLPISPFSGGQGRWNRRELLRREVIDRLGPHPALILVFLLSLPLLLLSAWLPVGGLLVSLLICWLAAARGYAVHAQILREAKRGISGRGARRGKAIGVITAPWYLLRSLPQLLPTLLIWALLGLLVNFVAAGLLHLPVLTHDYPAAGVNLWGHAAALVLLTGSPRSLSGLILGLTALGAWLLTSLAHSRPAPVITGLASAWTAITQRDYRTACQQAQTGQLGPDDVLGRPAAGGRPGSGPMADPATATCPTTDGPGHGRVRKSPAGILLAVLLAAFLATALSLFLTMPAISWSPLPA